MVEPNPGVLETDDEGEENATESNATETESPMRYVPVCVSDVSCSSFTASAADALSLVDKAHAALINIGVMEPLADPGTKRC